MALKGHTLFPLLYRTECQKRCTDNISLVSAGKALVSLAAVLTAIKGHVPMLLRHPCGAAMVDELYTLLTAQQRNHLAAEFYGREFTLLSQVSPLWLCTTIRPKIILKEMFSRPQIH